MSVHTAAAFPFSAKKMGRQASTVSKLRQQALANETVDTLDFIKVLKLMNEKYMPGDISDFIQKDRVEDLNEWTCGPREGAETNTADIIHLPASDDNKLGSILTHGPSTDDSAAANKGASQSSVRGEEPQDPVSEIRIPEPQREASLWRTVAEEANQEDESDAISDTSFTPPKHLTKHVQYDNEGRRHILPPPGFRDVAPKQQSRFVCRDEQNRKHLMPPPGFRGAIPKLIDESEWNPPAAIQFERKKDVKKEFEKQQVTYGGISLALMRQQSSRSKGKDNMCLFKVSTNRPSFSSKVQPVSPKTAAGLPPTDPLIGGWESAFLKGVFDAENDLLYGGHWPASTF